MHERVIRLPPDLDLFMAPYVDVYAGSAEEMTFLQHFGHRYR
ncbi:hypothetical protein [Nocardia vaccinii]|nr:hypothetical protein [Nocardia vaccinii]